MNKKLLLSLGIGITTFLLLDGISFADDLKQELLKYLESDKLDLLGREFDRILFQNIKEHQMAPYLNDAEFKAKLKFVLDDLRTLPLQAKCIWKILNQKENVLIYSSIGGTAYLKSIMGAKAFNEMLFKIFKLIVK